MTLARAAMAEGAPLHLQIRRSLEEAVVSGRLSPGSRVPTELELARQFGCARMTVARAVGALVEAGLLVRRRRAGTFVAQRRIEETVLEIHDIAAEVRASGRAYAFQRLSRRIRPAAPEDAARLGAAPGAPVLMVRGVHRADGEPLAAEERLIDLATVPQAREEPFTGISPGSWLLGHVPWTEAEHQIEAVGADSEVAALLGVAAGTACLCIERRTWRGASGVTWVRLTYPGDRRRLVGRFRTAARPRPLGT